MKGTGPPSCGGSEGTGCRRPSTVRRFWAVTGIFAVEQKNKVDFVSITYRAQSNGRSFGLFPQVLGHWAAEEAQDGATVLGHF